MKFKRTLLALCATLLALSTVACENNKNGNSSAALPWSQRMGNSVVRNNPGYYGVKWDYVNGTVLSGLQALYAKTGDKTYLEYIEATVQAHLPYYNPNTKTLDNVKEGTALLFLAENAVSLADRSTYKTAADSLRLLLEKPAASSQTGISRTSEGGLWHKDPGYAFQMWGDGLYMAEPFYAQYTATYDNATPEYFDDIANQFILFEKHARDSKTGLLYHGWSEKPEDDLSSCWADPVTGRSASFWGRAMGWYVMGLVDTLDYFPKNHPKYGELVAILGRLIPSLVAFQDSETGCWYDVVDQGPRAGTVRSNYFEASSNCMFAYSILKSVRLGYIDARYLKAGKKAYNGILSTFMEVRATDSGENLVFTNECTVSGLGGKQLRDGTFEYYMTEPVLTSEVDGKPIGPFILASLEYERL